MLRYLLSLSCCLLCIISAAYAQVGIGTATPNTKAILELNTTDKGLLLPRLTTAQRNSIGATAAEDGMIVFDTNLDSLMIYQAATNTWRSIAFTAIGSSAWNLNGNTGTNPATHYIGTNDNAHLVFRTGTPATERMRIQHSDGYVGIGTATPITKFHVYSPGETGLLIQAGGTQDPFLWMASPTINEDAALFIDESDARKLKIALGNVQTDTDRNNNTRITITQTGNIGIGTPTPNAELQLSNTPSNRKIVLYEFANNDYQVAALGINSGIFRYQVPAVLNEHAFYAGTSSIAGITLFRILGNGRVKVPPTSVLDLDNGIGNKRIILFEAAANDHEFNGLGINPGIFRYQAAAITNDHVFYAATGATSSNELLRIKGNGNVGIGTATPSTKLHVSANTGPAFRLVDGTEGAGKVLVSDANGNASWQTPPNTAWNLNGNTGTNPTFNYIGTGDAQSLRFKVNNQFSGLIEYATTDGNTAFGYNTMANPTAAGALRNVAVGDRVLAALINGDDNTGIGYRALAGNTTGLQNTAIGSLALHVNTAGDDNTGIGYRALAGNTTGVQNTAIGSFALHANTTGDDNTGIGYQALFSNTGGAGNVAAGNYALSSNTTGNFNVATGGNALRNNTIGSNNVATGFNALNSNTTGNRNISIGVDALRNNTIGNNNVATGADALRNNTIGNNNVATGADALRNNAIGDNNVATGADALRSNTTANNNIAIGFEALFTQSFNNGGTAWNSDNVAIGYQALRANQPTGTTNGYQNTAVGSGSLPANTTGHSNTGIGAQSLFTNTTGNYNTGLGRETLRNNTGGNNNTAGGWSALFNSNGNDNTAFGYQAGFSHSGSHNVFIGAGSGMSNNFSNAIAIGSGALVTSGNRIRMGNNAIANADIQVAWTVTSDKNEKSAIKYDVPGLNLITKLQPATYYYNSHLQAHGKEKSIRYTGLLAQDVDSVLRSLGIVSSIVSKPNADGSGSWGIRYSEIVMPLIKGMQEQQAQIEALQQENALLKALTTKLEAEQEKLKAAFEARLKLLEDRAGIKAEK